MQRKKQRNLCVLKFWLRVIDYCLSFVTNAKLKKKIYIFSGGHLFVQPLPLTRPSLNSTYKLIKPPAWSASTSLLGLNFLLTSCLAIINLLPRHFPRRSAEAILPCSYSLFVYAKQRPEFAIRMADIRLISGGYPSRHGWDR